MRAEARALKRARMYPEWLWARRLSTCKNEARTITINTMPAMMVRESTSEKPERLTFIIKRGTYRVIFLGGLSKNWFFTEGKIGLKSVV